MKEIEIQTGGEFKAQNFKPPGCENALCSFHGNFVLLSDGEIRPWTEHNANWCCQPEAARLGNEGSGIGAAKSRSFVARFWSQARAADKTENIPLGGWDEFLDRIHTWSLCISGMAFQDVWNLDLDRLRDCCIHVVDPLGRLIPFCAYNLTGAHGQTLYRTKD
jgi:hypothetical protein